MPTKKFEPKFMKVGVLTAALQELTPRKRRDPDPDIAIEEWLDFAKELSVDCIQLSAALHPSESDVPPEAMLDPVANTLDLRKPFDKKRASRVRAASKASGVGISDSDMSGRKSLGLLGMHERALLFGGEVRITGTPGHGTRVSVSIPLRQK